MCHNTRGANNHQSWVTTDQSSQIRLKPKQRGKSKTVLSTSVVSEREGKPRRYAPSELYTEASGDATVNVQLNSGPRMNRCILRLLVTAVALCGVGETRLQSSKIVFPPTQIPQTNKRTIARKQTLRRRKRKTRNRLPNMDTALRSPPQHARQKN